MARVDWWQSRWLHPDPDSLSALVLRAPDSCQGLGVLMGSDPLLCAFPSRIASPVCPAVQGRGRLCLCNVFKAKVQRCLKFAGQMVSKQLLCAGLGWAPGADS